MSTGQGYIGWNMFAYCNNNPVMYSDPDGYRFEANQFGPNAMAYESAGSHKPGSQFVSNLNTKCKKTINAIVKNCEVSAGVGLGLYLGFDLLSIASGDSWTEFIASLIGLLGSGVVLLAILNRFH